MPNKIKNKHGKNIRMPKINEQKICIFFSKKEPSTFCLQNGEKNKTKELKAEKNMVKSVEHIVKM